MSCTTSRYADCDSSHRHMTADSRSLGVRAPNSRRSRIASMAASARANQASATASRSRKHRRTSGRLRSRASATSWSRTFSQPTDRARSIAASTIRDSREARAAMPLPHHDLDPPTGGQPDAPRQAVERQETRDPEVLERHATRQGFHRVSGPDRDDSQAERPVGRRLGPVRAAGNCTSCVAVPGGDPARPRAA